MSRTSRPSSDPGPGRRAAADTCRTSRSCGTGTSRKAQEGKFQRIYLVTRKASLTGQCVSSAKVSWGGDAAYPERPASVSMDFDRTGKALFSKVTGENVDRRLAIVLDDIVHSAPNIQEKISGGTGASITGSFTTGAGQGPGHRARGRRASGSAQDSRGADGRAVPGQRLHPQRHTGLRDRRHRDCLIFMVVFYSLSGLIADVALVLNLLILLAAMAGLKGHAHPAGHRGRDPLARHGGGRQRDHLRAHKGGAAGRQDHPQGHTGRLLPGLPYDSGLQRNHR